jgi:hypothetical protein
MSDGPDGLKDTFSLTTQAWMEMVQDHTLGAEQFSAAPISLS